MKVNHKFNDKNRIYLSSYLGDDKARLRTTGHLYDYDASGNSVKTGHYKNNYGLKWGNITTALRWNNIITNKLFSNVTATYSRYRFNVASDSYSYRKTATDTLIRYGKTNYGSGIRDYAVKLDFDYLPQPNHYIRFGAQATDHLFSAGVLNVQETAVIDTLIGARPIQAQEYLAYLEDDFRISNKLKVNLGIHASAFGVNGRVYHSLQPRLAMRYLLTTDIALKASYAQMTQFIHLLTNAGLGLPTDLWVPATPLNGPEKSWVSALGGAYNINNTYELSIEGYYKEMTGLIEYKDGATYLNIENDWQTKVEAGRGRSFGAEIFLQKKKGRLNGWFGYTLSKTDRTFPNVNNGKTFPYKYDRRHDLEILTNYQLRENKSFSLTWVYASGNAITIPQSTYMPYDGDGFYNDIRYHSSRNSFRMRDYHRLDLSYTITKKKKWGERSWSFGVYNGYSRSNPFYMDIEKNKQGAKHFVQYSLFPIVPSISYKFKF